MSSFSKKTKKQKDKNNSPSEKKKTRRWALWKLYPCCILVEIEDLREISQILTEFTEIGPLAHLLTMLAMHQHSVDLDHVLFWSGITGQFTQYLERDQQNITLIVNSEYCTTICGVHSLHIFLPERSGKCVSGASWKVYRHYRDSSWIFLTFNHHFEKPSVSVISHGA